MGRIFTRTWPSHVNAVVVNRLDHPHGDSNDNSLLTLMARLFVGSNLICTTIHRALTRLFAEHRDQDPCIGELLLQVDNCTMENMTHALLEYLESLMGCRVAGMVEIYFVEVGHVDIIIDQIVSRYFWLQLLCAFVEHHRLSGLGRHFRSADTIGLHGLASGRREGLVVSRVPSQRSPRCR